MRLRSVFPLVLLTFAACSKLTAPPPPEPIASDTPVTMASAPTRPTTVAPPQPPPAGAQGELKIDDVVVGKGPEVKNGDTVSVHYTGTLVDGTKFDSSHDHPGNQPLTTPIPGRVIAGWNKGLVGMRVGGKRKLTIPPALGYGDHGQGKIPPNATLIFDIELVDLKPGAPQRPLLQPKGP